MCNPILSHPELEFSISSELRDSKTVFIFRYGSHESEVGHLNIDEFAMLLDELHKNAHDEAGLRQ